MLITEEQAREKWCPHARQSTDGFATYNRKENGEVADSCLCVASGCMAWRSCGPQRETMRNYHDDTEVPVSYASGHRTYPDGWQYGHTDKDQAGRGFDLLHRQPSADAPAVGFCGAFGRPEF